MTFKEFADEASNSKPYFSCLQHKHLKIIPGTLSFFVGI